MDNSTLFLTGCLPARAAYTYFAWSGHERLRLLAVLPAAAWLSGALDSKDKGFFGGEAYWKDHRFTHGAMWALYALTGRAQFLAADTVMGAAIAYDHYKDEKKNNSHPPTR